QRAVSSYSNDHVNPELFASTEIARNDIVGIPTPKAHPSTEQMLCQRRVALKGGSSKNNFVNAFYRAALFQAPFYRGNTTDRKNSLPRQAGRLHATSDDDPDASLPEIHCSKRSAC